MHGAGLGGADADRRRIENRLQGLPPVMSTTCGLHGMAQRVLAEVAARLSREARERDVPLRLAERIGAIVRDTELATPVDAALAALNARPASYPDKLTALEEVARQLGDDWTQDATSFLAVTIAMGRLQCLLRRISQGRPAEPSDAPRGKSLLLTPPNEEHTFGVCLLEELMRAYGWETTIYRADSVESLVKRMEKSQIDIVCFSWTNAALAPSVGDCVKAIDQLPAANRPAIISGGHAAGQNPAWLVRLGVNYVCESVYVAVQIADVHLRELRAVSRQDSTPLACADPRP